MNEKSYRNLYHIVAALILLFHISCGNNKKPIVSPDKINEWFTHIENLKYKNNDSILYYATLIELNARNQKNEYQAMGEIGFGIYNLYKSAYYASFTHYNKAVELLINSPADSLKTRAYSGIGNYYKNIGDYAPALENMFTALKFAEKTGSVIYIAGIHSNIAQVYQTKGDIMNAKFHINETLALLQNNKASPPYLIAAHTLANIYGESGNLDSALLIDKMCIEICDAIGSKDLKSTFYDNKANCFMYSNRFDSALYYFKECIKIDSAANDSKQVSDTYYNLGTLALLQKKHPLAEKNLIKSIELANYSGYKRGKQMALELLSDVYKQKGNLLASIAAKDSAIKIKDELLNFKTQSRIEELRTIYETEKKEQTIQLQQARLSRQAILITGIIAIAIALGFAGYFYYRRLQIKKEKAAQEILYKQQQQAIINVLQAEEKERKRIALDLHDGIGQLMMAAWLNLQVVDESNSQMVPYQKELLKKSISLVDESCKEIRSVSHSMMPNALLKKGLVNAVRDFIQQIDSNQLSINLQTEGLQVALPLHVETILYRVIQECVNNVIKHAAATQLDISINKDDVGTDVLIEDNGKGFNIKEALQKDGIGLQNIKDRVEYLSGKVSWDTNDGNGTVVAIFIPSAT